MVFAQIRPISHQKIYSWLETIHPSLLTHLSRLSEPREIPSWPVNKGLLGTSSRPLLYGFFGQRSLIYLSSDIRIDPQNDIKIDPPSEGIKERHLTCRPVTAGRPWRGKARQMPFLAAAHPRLFIQSYPTQTLSKCLGSRNGNSLFISCKDAWALACS